MKNVDYATMYRLELIERYGDIPVSLIDDPALADWYNVDEGVARGLHLSELQLLSAF